MEEEEVSPSRKKSGVIVYWYQPGGGRRIRNKEDIDIDKTKAINNL